MPRNANRTNVSWAPAPPAFAIRNARYSVEILRRPTANGLAYHHDMRISGDTIVDFDSRGTHFRSVADFGGGLPISILRRFPREEYSAIMRRLKIILSEDRPYHLANWNCESFVNRATDGRSESLQIRDWFFISVIVGLLLA